MTTPLARRALGLSALAVALLPGAEASAHAHLKSTIPAANSTVKPAPASVTIVFSEAIEPKLSSIEVFDASSARVDDGAPRAVPSDKLRLTVGLGALKPGSYKVVWKVTSVDTHRTEGSFTFRVGA